MNTDRIKELEKLVADLGNLKGEFGDVALGDWCNGLICLSAALYHEAHELSRKAHTFPRKAIKELVAACFLLMSVVPYAMQAATNETPRVCWIDPQLGSTNTSWQEIVDGISTGMVLSIIRQGTTNKTWWVINYETNNVPTNAASGITIVDCP